jgi:hypothetical protein
VYLELLAELLTFSKLSITLRFIYIRIYPNWH